MKTGNLVVEFVILHRSEPRIPKTGCTTDLLDPTVTNTGSTLLFFNKVEKTQQGNS